jgi:hypothetical protein
MFGIFQRSTQRDNKNKRSRNKLFRPLRIEPLEGRALLAGDVTVTLAANTLTIIGDASANEVEITPGASVGEYVITGLNNTIINGPSLIVDPFNLIEVDLEGGSDIFRVRGASAANRILIPGDIEIDNDDGNNTNELINVQLNDDLTITKTGGVSENNLEVAGSLIIGDVTLSHSGFDGDSKTLIHDSQVQGNLSITNAVGEDHFVTYASTIDGNVDIDNGDGDTRTVFGITEDPIIFGTLTITNGAGNDKVFVHDTEVWLDVDIDNNDGHTLVSVEESDFGLGVGVGSTGDFELDNGAGIDEFTWTDSTVRDDLRINNHGNADGAAPPAADAYGGRIVITATASQRSRIGNDLDVEGDNGLEVINISHTDVVDDVASFALHDGGSQVVFLDVFFSENLTFEALDGNDNIRFEETTVDGDTTIETNGGNDLLEILAGSELLGSSELDGGAGIDTLRRQVITAPTIVIAFLDLETFELDFFV